MWRLERARKPWAAAPLADICGRMDLYELFKTIHVLAAVSWVGAVVVSQVHAAWVAKRNSPEDFRHFVDLQAHLGTRYFPILAVTTIAAGIGMVIESGWNFSDAWIAIGITLWILSVAIGAGFLGPQSIKIQEGLAAGPPDTELQERINKVKFASQADTAILVLVVADMVIKPTF